MESSERRPAPTLQAFTSRDQLRASQGARTSRPVFPLPTLPGQRTEIGALPAPIQPTCAAGRWTYKGRVYFEPGCETPASAPITPTKPRQQRGYAMYKYTCTIRPPGTATFLLQGHGRRAKQSHGGIICWPKANPKLRDWQRKASENEPQD